MFLNPMHVVRVNKPHIMMVCGKYRAYGDHHSNWQNTEWQRRKNEVDKFVRRLNGEASCR